MRRQAASSGVSTVKQNHLPNGASRLAALLHAEMYPTLSLLAPRDSGAALRQLVLLHRGRAISGKVV